MQNLINKYPLDLTGKSPDNFVIGEPHDLNDSGTGPYRVFVPIYGGFYTNNIKLYDAGGKILQPHVDFVASYLYEEATRRSGLEVCGAIIVTNPNVSNRVYFDYQVVGGDYAVSTKVMSEIIAAINDDTRPIEWGNIIGKPDVYPAAGHRHALWELYGFEYVITELERITQAIIAGDQAVFDELRDYIYRMHVAAKEYTDALDRRFVDHKEDYTNPHRVTKAQVGLGSVDNFPTATDNEIYAGTATNRFVTPRGMYRGVEKQVGEALLAHTDDKTNPHEVTKAQVGLSNVVNYGVATDAQAKNMTASNVYVVASQLRVALDRHIELGEHDSRYVRKDVVENTSLRVVNGQLQAVVNGSWRVVWPAQWA